MEEAVAHGQVWRDGWGIRVVLWDLDGTLINGTLDEGEWEPVAPLFEVVRSLARRGVVSSIVSRNSFSTARDALQQCGHWEQFVFPTISFGQSFCKAAACRRVLEMLRQPVCAALLVDDSAYERAAASSMLPGLHVAHPAELAGIPISLWGVDDPACTKLSQYRMMEARDEARRALEDSHAVDLLESQRAFLRSCEVRATLDRLRSATDAELDRVAALTVKTNRLNFTRVRRRWYWEFLEEDTDLLQAAASGSEGEAAERPRVLSPTCTCCWKVYVRDRFGDHGLCGVVALKQGVLRHFLFSCRLLALSIEGAVFSWLRERLQGLHWSASLSPDSISALLQQDSSHVQVVEATTHASAALSPAKPPYGVHHTLPPRLTVLACGWCATATLVPFLSTDGVDVTLASEEYDDFALTSLLMLQQHSERPSVVQRVISYESNRIEISRGCDGAKSPSHHTLSPSANPFFREQQAFRGGYDVLLWDLERDTLWPVASAATHDRDGTHAASTEACLVPVDLQHWLPRSSCSLVRTWIELWRQQECGAEERHDLVNARMLTAKEIVEQVGWLRGQLPAETKLVLLGVPAALFQSNSPLLAPAWRQVISHFPDNLRIGLAEHLLNVNAAVASRVPEWSNTSFVPREDHCRDGDLLEWVHTSHRATCAIGKAVLAAATATSPQLPEAEEYSTSVSLDSDGDVLVPRRSGRKRRYDEVSASPRLVPGIVQPPHGEYVIIERVFEPGTQVYVDRLLKHLDLNGCQTREGVPGFKQAVTNCIHFNRHYDTPGKGLQGEAGAWLFEPIVRALREADAQLHVLQPRSWFTGLQYNRYDGEKGDHFDMFHLDEFAPV
ncbi:hypothetical protein AB1Y20_022315 [Prymnesium parvum]|uniref:FCP1 homology domain-containing protein n=1 Tax=Prymnesium parvum TaxID=97485 RepID=A0AB34JJ86_PRYPA